MGASSQKSLLEPSCLVHKAKATSPSAASIFPSVPWAFLSCFQKMLGVATPKSPWFCKGKAGSDQGEASLVSRTAFRAQLN